MNDAPGVTIITPTYNHERFIAECLESALAQTYENWEQIVVDDGSTDETAAIVARYAAVDSRIRLLTQQNKGIWRLAETYNTALDEARGDFIAILEGDDYWPQQKLEKQLPLHKAGVLLTYGETLAVSKSGKPLHLLPKPPFTGAVDSVTFLRYLLCRESAIQPVSAICNANALRKIGGFHQDSFPAVDYPTFVRLAQLPGRFVFKPDLLGYWRQHGEQVTARRGVELIEGRVSISLDQYTLLDESTLVQLRLSKESIINAHAEGLADGYLVAVRNALQEERRESLRYPLRGLWRFGGTRRKLQAVYALLAINFGWDMEWILEVYRKVECARTRRKQRKYGY